jgi:TonB family protein
MEILTKGLMYRWLTPLLSLPVMLQAQPPEARDLLANSAAELFTAKRVKIAGTLVVAGQVNGNPENLETSFSLEFERGGRVRRETTTAGQTILQIFDGTDVWTYTSPGKTYSKSPGARIAEYSELRSLSYGRDLGNVLSATVERSEPVPFDGQPVTCYVVRAAYKGTPNGGVVAGVTRTVWITQDGGKVLRDVWEIPWSLPTGPTVATATTTYTTVESGSAVADDRFVFHPPEGSAPASRSVQPTIALGSGGGIGSPTGAGIGTASGSGASAARADVPVAPLRKVDPAYPEAARAAGLQGMVFVTVAIADGRVTDASVKRGLGMGMDQAALAAVRQWQYPPGTNMQRMVQVAFHADPPGRWFVADSELTVGGAIPLNSVVVKPRFSAYRAMVDSECTADSTYIAVPLQIAPDGSSDHTGWRFEAATVDDEPRPASGTVLMECRIPGAPATAAGTGPTVRVGNGVSAPVAIFRPEPEYSEQARRAKYQGTVLLGVVIDANGKASQVRVLRARGLGLDEQAVENVFRWRFKPATKEGKPVAVEAQITVNFKLL